MTGAATLLGGLLSASHSLEMSQHKCHYVDPFSSYKPGRGDTSSFSGSEWLELTCAFLFCFEQRLS